MSFALPIGRAGIGQRFTQQGVALTLLMVIVGILVLGPVAILLRASFAPAGTMPLETWQFSLEHYR